MAAAKKPTYHKKLNSEEKRSGRLMLLKGQWRVFPAPGGKVALRFEGRTLESAVEAEDCCCVPPPHQHRYLLLGVPLSSAGAVELEKNADGSYEVKLSRGR